MLDKLCVIVDLSFVDDLPPSQAEIVSNVKASTGCFINGNVANYRTYPLTEEADGSKRISFDSISVEVRNG